jgi:hypothetical protein
METTHNYKEDILHYAYFIYDKLKLVSEGIDPHHHTAAADLLAVAETLEILCELYRKCYSSK